jgi:uncharacterized membrane protein
MKSLLVIFVQLLAALLIPGTIFWPYFAGAALLIIGMAGMVRSGALQTRGMDRAVVFGPLFFAIPMAVFGVDHFIAPKIVAALVPSWIPWHRFWVYFVGVALIASSLSIVTRKLSGLAATLLSAMILSFVLLIHVPNLATNLGDRFAFAVLLRDTSFSAGALALALAEADKRTERRFSLITALLRYAIAVPAALFGIEHFLHPDFVPVVPLRQPMPSWIPGHLFLAYGTGAVLIASGLSIAFNWKARLAATRLGIFVFIIVALIYLPIMVANISNIADGLNYLVDTLAFSGAALLLAGALPSKQHEEVALKNRRESAPLTGLLQDGDT